MADYINAHDMATFLRARQGAEAKVAADWADENPDHPGARAAVDWLEGRFRSMASSEKFLLEVGDALLPLNYDETETARLRACLWHVHKRHATPELLEMKSWLRMSQAAMKQVKSRLSGWSKKLTEDLTRAMGQGRPEHVRCVEGPTGTHSWCGRDLDNHFKNIDEAIFKSRSDKLVVCPACSAVIAGCLKEVTWGE